MHKLWNLLEEPEERMHILFHSLIQNIYVNTNHAGWWADSMEVRQGSVPMLFHSRFLNILHAQERKIPSLTILQGHRKSELTYSKGYPSQKNVYYFELKFLSVRDIGLIRTKQLVRKVQKDKIYIHTRISIPIMKMKLKRQENTTSYPAGRL